MVLTLLLSTEFQLPLSTPLSADERGLSQSATALRGRSHVFWSSSLVQIRECPRPDVPARNR